MISATFSGPLFGCSQRESLLGEHPEGEPPGFFAGSLSAGTVDRVTGRADRPHNVAVAFCPTRDREAVRARRRAPGSSKYPAIPRRARRTMPSIRSVPASVAADIFRLAGCGKSPPSFRDGPSGPGPEPMNTGQALDFSSRCSWISGSQAKPAPRDDHVPSFFRGLSGSRVYQSRGFSLFTERNSGKVEQEFGLAAARAEMQVRDSNRAIRKQSRLMRHLVSPSASIRSVPSRPRSASAAG